MTTAIRTLRLYCAGLALAIYAGIFAPVGACAQSTPDAVDKPFAERRIVLQLSDRDASKQSLVLSVANNLLRAYDPDKIAIEVVTFGPGIDLLVAENENRERVDSLVAQGVRFDICLNTVASVERQTGRRPVLNPKARPVEFGVGEIMTLVGNGYTLVRP